LALILFANESGVLGDPADTVLVVTTAFQTLVVKLEQLLDDVHALLFAMDELSVTNCEDVMHAERDTRPEAALDPIYDSIFR
jgi:hypothetical protein